MATKDQIARAAIEDELRAGIREEVEEEAETLFRQKLTKEFKEAQERQAPSARDREQCKDVLRELEVESLVLAQAASAERDQLESDLKERRAFAWISGLGLPLGFLPVLCVMNSMGYHYDGFTFWAVAVPWAVAAIVALAANTAALADRHRKREELEKFLASYRKVALDARSKRKLLVDIELTRDSVIRLPYEIRSSLNGLHDHFQPSDVGIYKARQYVRDHIVEEMDPELLLRVDPAKLDLENDEVVREEGAQRWSGSR